MEFAGNSIIYPQTQNKCFKEYYVDSCTTHTRLTPTIDTSHRVFIINKAFPLEHVDASNDGTSVGDNLCVIGFDEEDIEILQTIVPKTMTDKLCAFNCSTDCTCVAYQVVGGTCTHFKFTDIEQKESDVSVKVCVRSKSSVMLGSQNAHGTADGKVNFLTMLPGFTEMSMGEDSFKIGTAVFSESSEFEAGLPVHDNNFATVDKISTLFFCLTNTTVLSVPKFLTLGDDTTLDLTSSGDHALTFKGTTLEHSTTDPVFTLEIDIESSDFNGIFFVWVINTDDEWHKTTLPKDAHNCNLQE